MPNQPNQPVDVVKAIIGGIPVHDFDALAKSSNMNVQLLDPKTSYEQNKDVLGEMDYPTFEKFYNDRVIPYDKARKDASWLKEDITNLFSRPSGAVFGNFNQPKELTFAPTLNTDVRETDPVRTALSQKPFTDSSDIQAERAGYYNTLDGLQKPIEEHKIDKGTVLVPQQDEETGVWRYKETPLGDVAQGFNMRTAFGPKTLTKSFDIARAVGNSFSSIISAIGHAGEVGTRLVTFGNVDDQSKAVRWSRALQNLGEYGTSRAQEDDNTGITLYNTADGLSQLFQQVALAYGTGGVATMAELGIIGTTEALAKSGGKKAMGGFSKAAWDILESNLGREGAEAAMGRVSKAGFVAGLGFGSLQAAGAWKSQARTLGINEQDAALMYLGIGSITAAIEAKIGPNQFISFWERPGGLKKVGAEKLAESLFTYQKKGGYASMKEMMANDKGGAMKYALSEFSKVMGDASEKLMETRAGRAALGFWEEGAEEYIENVQDKTFQAGYDMLAPFIYDKMGRDKTNLQNGDGLFGTSIEDIMKGNEQDFLVGGMAGLIGGGMMSGNHAKNVAYHSITQGFAAKGRDAGNEYRDEINQAVKDVKEGRTSWIENAFMMPTGEKFTFGTDNLARAKYNAAELSKLVDMAENIYFNTGLDELNKKVGSLQDSKQRQQLSYLLEQEIIPQALKQESYIPIREQKIEELKQSEDPAAGQEIAKLQKEIADWAGMDKVVYDPATKTSPKFNMYYNDVLAVNDENNPSATKYAKMTPNGTGLGVFSNHLMFAEAAHGINTERQKANEELKQQQQAGDDAVNSFVDKAKQYDVLANPAHHEEAFKEIAALFNHPMSDETKQKAVTAIDSIATNFRGTLEEGDEDPYLKSVEALNARQERKEQPMLTPFDLYSTSQAVDDGTGTGTQQIQSFAHDIDHKIEALRTDTNANEAEINNLEAQLDSHEAIAETSAIVWSKYDSTQKQNLGSPSIKEVQHQPITPEQLDALRKKNVERRQKIQEIRGEVAKNKKGLIIEMARNQNNDLKRRQHMLRSIFTVLKLKDQIDLLEQVKLIDSASVNDKSLEALNAEDKKIQNLEQYLWDNDKIKSVRKNIAKIMNDISDPAAYRDFEYFDIKMDKASEYSLFAGGKGGSLDESRIARIYALNYFHSLLHVSPKEFNSVYLKSLENDENGIITSYEQEQVEKTAYAHTQVPDTSWMLDTVNGGVDLFKETTKLGGTPILTNAFLIRGLGRSGKSTETTARTVKMASVKAGRQLNVLVIGPNEQLAKIHQDNVGKSAALKFMFTDEVDSAHNLNQYDMVIVDETSILTDNQIYNELDRGNESFTKMLKGLEKGKPVLLLGDDTQIVGRNEQGSAMTYVPVSHYCLRSPSMAFRFATGNQDIWNLENAILNSIAMQGKISPAISYPNTFYKADHTSGVMQTVSKKEIVDAFVTDFKANPGKESEFMLLTTNEEEAQLMRDMLQSQGIDGKYVKPVEYSPKRTSAQGGRWPRVYIAIEENRTDSNNARVLNTAVGRSSGFIAIVGTGKSEVGNTIDILKADPEKTAMLQKALADNQAIRLKMLSEVSGNMEDMKSKATKEEQSLLDKIRELNSKVKYPNDTNPKYVINDTDHERVHTVMKSKSSENYDSRPQGTPYALGLGNLGDQIAKDAMVLTTKENIIAQIKKLVATPVEFQNGDKPQQLQVIMSDDDIERLANDFIKLFNGEKIPGLTRDLIVPQAVVNGDIEGTKVAGAMDFAWVKNNKVSKLDVKTYRPNKDGTPKARSVESWNEQMGIYENLLVQLGLDSNNETFIIGIPLDYETPKDGRTSISVKYAESGLHVTALADIAKTKQPAPKQQPKASTKTRTTTEQQTNPDTEDFADFSTEEAENFGNKYKEQLINNGVRQMVGMTMFPLLHSDVALGGHRGSGFKNKENSLHTAIVNTAIRQINSLMDSGVPVRLKVVYNEDATKQFVSSSATAVNNALSTAEKYLGPLNGKLPSITLAIDPTLDNYHADIAEAMVTEYKRLTKNGTDYNYMVKQLQEAGYFNLSMLYSFRDNAPAEAKQMYLDLAAMHKILKTSKESFYVPVTSKIPAAVFKKYGGDVTSLEDLIADVNSRKESGARQVIIQKDGFRYVANISLTGDPNTAIKVELGGKYAIEDGQLIKQLQDSINAIANDDRSRGSTTNDVVSFESAKTNAMWQTMRQNATWLVNIERKGAEITGITAKKNQPDLTRFFGLSKGKDGKVYVMPKVNGKVVGMNASSNVWYQPTAAEYKAYFKEFTGELKSKIDNDPEFAKKFRTNFGIMKDGSQKEELAINPKDYPNIVVEGKHLSMPKITVDMNPVFNQEAGMPLGVNNNPAPNNTNTQYNPDLLFMVRYEKKKKSDGLADINVGGTVNLQQVDFSVDNITPEQVESITDENRIITFSPVAKSWSRLTAMFGNDEFARNNWVSAVIRTIRKQNIHGMDVNKYESVDGELTSPDYKIENSIERARLKLRADAGLKQDIETIFDLIKNGQESEVDNASLLRHEAIFGTLDFETQKFDRDGLIGKINKNGFNSLSFDQRMRFMTYMMGSDIYFNAAVYSVWPNYKPDTNTIENIIELKDNDATKDIASEFTLRRNYGAEYGASDNTSTYTAQLDVLFRSLSIIRNRTISSKGKLISLPYNEAISTEKLKHVLLKVGVDRYTTDVPAGMANTDANRFWTSLVNARNSNPQSHDGEVLTSLLNVVGAPYELLDGNKTAFKERLRATLRNGGDMSYYDMYYNTADIADAMMYNSGFKEGMELPGELQTKINALAFKKETARQMITQLLGYYRSVNIDRLATALLKENNQFRLKPLDSMNEADIQRNMILGLTSHVQIGSTGLYIPASTRRNVSKYSIAEKDGKISLSIGSNEIIAINQTAAGLTFSFAQGRAKKSVVDLSKLLKLNLNSGFFDTFVSSRGNSEAKLAKILGSMTISLMDMSNTFEVQQMQQNIKDLQKPVDGAYGLKSTIGMEGKQLEAAIAFNNEVNNKIQEVQTKIDEAKESSKLIAGLISSFENEGNLQPAPIDVSDFEFDETFAEGEEEIDENIIEEQKSAVVKGPMNFPGYIRELAAVNSSTFDVKSLSKAYNAAGKRQYTLNWGNRINKFVPGTNIASVNGKFSTTANSPEWRGYSNNVIGSGVLIVSNPRLLVGTKNEFQGVKQSSLTEKDRYRIAADAFINSVNNMNKFQMADVVATILGESSYSTVNATDFGGKVLEVKNSTREVTSTDIDGKKKKEKKAIKVHAITNEFWDFAYHSFETLANKAEERRAVAEAMFKNSGNADLQFLSTLRGKEEDTVLQFIKHQQTMLLPGNIEGQKQHNTLMADAQFHLRLNQDYRIEKVDGIKMLLPGSDFLKSNAHVAFKLHKLQVELFNETDPAKERQLKTKIKNLHSSLPFYNDYGAAILKNEQNRQNKAQTLRDLLKKELNDYFDYTKQTLWTPNKFVQWNVLDKEGNPAFSKTVTNTYLDEKGVEKTTYGKEYNPAYEAFFYHSVITNMSLGDQQLGSFGAYKDILEFYKRIKSAGGPGIVPITSDEVDENIPSKLNAIVTRDVKGRQSKENRSNGAIYLHPLADIALINSYGGIEANGGILKQGIKKPLLMDVDINGRPIQLKCAFVPNDHHMMASSKEKMAEFRRTTGPTLLAAFDRIVDEIEAEAPNLAQHKVYEQALLSLNQMVKDNPKLHSEIAHMIIPIDAIKSGITGLVNFWQDGEQDPTYHNYYGLGENPELDAIAIQKIDIRELRIQQEASRTVGETNVSYPTQWLEWLSTIEGQNKNAQKVDTVRSEMTASYLSVMNNMLGDPDEAMKFMRDLGLDGQELSSAQTITDALLRNKKVNLDLEPLVHKLTEKLFNHINKFGVKAMQSGQIMKQVPGYHIKRYTYNGSSMSYRGMVRLLKRGVIDSKTFKDSVAAASAQSLEEPRNENGKLIKGQMAAPFYYRKQYGIPEGADQSEIFGVILDNQYTDLRSLTVAQILELTIDRQSEGNWILEKFERIENAEVKANEIYNFLQLMKKLNTHFVVRTPSVGSSAGWYENVEWSTSDNNTAMFPDAKSDRDGTDFDYDDVSVLSYALNKDLEVASEINHNPKDVREHNRNLGAYQNRIMDILDTAFDNPKSFEQLTEATSVQAYLDLVDDKPLANQTLPYNPSVNNQVADEFTKSKNLVGVTANIAKAYNLFFGAMMNIQSKGDHWNSQMVPTSVASGNLAYGKTTGSVLGNRINMVIDNGKIIAMNAINLNSITGTIQAAMIWEGLPSAYTEEQKAQYGEDRPASVVEFFDKPYIKNFIKRIENSKSITYFGSLNLISELKEKISDMQARVNRAEQSPMITRAKEMVEQGYHEGLLDDYEKQLAILETEREAVKNGQSLAQVRGISFDDNEEQIEDKKLLLSNEDIRKQRNRNKAATDIDLAKIQEEIDLLNQEIYKLQIVNRLADFNTLLGYARRGEALRRFAKVASLNQGTEVNNAELYADKREIEFILGSSLSAFNEGVNDAYDYMSYYTGLSADDYNKVKEEEEFIRGNAENLPLIDIRQVVDARPQMKQQLKAMELGFKFKDVVFDTNEPVFNKIHDKIMTLVGGSGYKFSSQYYSLRTEVSKFMRDMFYEHEYNHKTAESDKKFDFVAGINDFLGAIRNLPGQNEDYYFDYKNDYTIAGDLRGKVFLGQVIGLCEFIHNNLGESSDRVNMEMAKRNPLIQRMRVIASNSGSKYIQLVGADSTNDGTVGLLRDGFKNLYNPNAENENERNVSIVIDGVNYNIGEWLQQALRHYQFQANAFTVKRSSFPHILDDALMVEYSKFADKFSQHIEQDMPIQMLHGFKEPSEIFRLAALEIPLADANLVPITMKKSDKMEYADRKYFVKKMGAFKKYEVYRQEQNEDGKADEKLAYYPVKLKAGPVGIRYTTAEENGLPANVSYGNKVSIYGADYASFIRLMNGYDNVDLFFDRKVTYLKANTVINVDGLPVIVNEVRNSSITVSPLANGYAASDMAQTIAMSERIQEAREKGNSDEENQKKINNCKTK